MHNLVLSASTIIGDDVVNSAGENLGELKEIMLDVETGNIAYAVLSFGGFLGMGDKLFAIPWPAMKLNTEKEAFILDLAKEDLEDAPGFDKDDWPTTIERDFLIEIYDFYGYEPYWE